jgi:excinuclease UvrABC ATPase subunit
MTEPGSDIEIERATALNLKGISLNIKKGCLWVTGPIGSGKTALLKHTIAAEADYRAATLLNPLEEDSPPFSQAKIKNLPAVIFISGENPIPPNHSAGDHFGLIRSIGRLLANSPFVNCLNCAHAQKIETFNEQIQSITPPVDCNQIKVCAQTHASPEDAILIQNKWNHNGYEQIHTTKLADRVTLSIQLDSISIGEFSKKRLEETTASVLKLNARYYLISYLKDGDLQKEDKILINRECRKCGESFPKVQPTLLSDAINRLQFENSTAAQNYMLSGYSLSQTGDLTGEKLTHLPFYQLKQTPEIFSRLDFAQKAAIENLCNSKLTNIKINTPLSELNFKEYLLLNLIKAFSLAPANSLIVLDEPFITPDSSDISVLNNSINKHLAVGGSVIIGSLDDSFQELANQKVYLGPSSGIHGGAVVETPKNETIKTTPSQVKQLHIGLNRNSLLSLESTKDPIRLDWKNLYQGKEKSVLSSIKISDELIELFASTIAAKSLGLNNKSFSTINPTNPQAQLIRYKGRTFEETCGLSLSRIRAEFEDIIKIRQRIDIGITFGLEHLSLAQKFSTLSWREKILLTVVGLVISKPRNRIIEIRNILAALPEKNLSLVISYLKDSLGKTNSITIEL